MPVPPFILYYRADDGPRLVRVLTIRHGSRSQPRRFR
jgi:plasmid stabilization system protein ParE